MDVIASSVWEHCAAGLKQKNVWKVDYAEAADLLQKNVSLGEKWLATCKQLTEIFWPNYSGNPWRDEVYRPTDLINSVDLLKEVSWSWMVVVVCLDCFGYLYWLSVMIVLVFSLGCLDDLCCLL